MRQPWLVFAAALAGSALLAVGFAIGVNRALAASGPAPHLATVSPDVLSRAGLSLSAPAVPPYCGAVAAASAQGWLSGDAGDCPIGRQEAETAAGRGRDVIETLLANVSRTRGDRGDQGRLEWLVVVRYSSLQMPLYVCPGPTPVGACPAVAPSYSGMEVVFVDAHTAQLVRVLPAG